MARPRDYKAEYRRRIANATAKGLTRSQARGHAKAAERPARPLPEKGTNDPRLERALKRLRSGTSLTEAAKLEHVSRERLRRFLADKNLAGRTGRSWTITDQRARQVPIVTKGKYRVVRVPDFENASLAGAYANDVGRFLSTNMVDFLTPYSGRGVKDSEGRFHPFEINPNTLYRLASADLPVFHEIYEIVQ